MLFDPKKYLPVIIKLLLIPEGDQIVSKSKKEEDFVS